MIYCGNLRHAVSGVSLTGHCERVTVRALSRVYPASMVDISCPILTPVVQ